MVLPYIARRWHRVSGWIFLAATVVAGRAADPSPAVALTPAERAWIDAHPVVKVGYDVRTAPFCFYDSKGRAVGIDLDYLRLISQKTGLQFLGVPSDTGWLEPFRTAPTPPVDLMTDLGYLPDRESFLSYTLPYCSSAIVMITREDAPAGLSPSDLGHRRIGVVSGFEAQQVALTQAAPDAEVVTFSDDLTLLRAVAAGKCYAGIDDSLTAAYFMRRHGLTHLRLGDSLPFPEGNYFGVRKGEPMLVEILNKAIADISEEERNAIQTRWVGIEAELGHRWARAFRIAALVAAGIAGILIVVFIQSRRLKRELGERLRVQRELKEAHDRLALLSAEQIRILRMVAHDLRGPLTNILLNADLLEMAPPPESRPTTSLAGAIRSSARSMDQLIQELLSSHRIVDGNASLKIAAVDLAAIARTAIAGLTATARAKEITLELAGSAALPLESDADALAKVINNLLSNALKYSPPGTAVTVTVEAGAGCVRLSVLDQGPGVKPEERETIFALYGRGSAQPTAGETSYGLGLWIVRKLLGDLGGRVWCEAGPESGACFTVELPLRPPPPAPVSPEVNRS
jgi:signal transduction histidine kinase